MINQLNNAAPIAGAGAVSAATGVKPAATSGDSPVRGLVAHSSEASKKPFDLKSLANEANKDMQSRSKSIEFSVDGDTGISVVKVIDKETNDVITQLPQKEMMDVARALKKSSKAVFLNKET